MSSGSDHSWITPGTAEHIPLLLSCCAGALVQLSLTPIPPTMSSPTEHEMSWHISSAAFLHFQLLSHCPFPSTLAVASWAAPLAAQKLQFLQWLPLCQGLEPAVVPETLAQDTAQQRMDKERFDQRLTYSSALQKHLHAASLAVTVSQINLPP